MLTAPFLPSSPRHLVVLGSSSSEVFDYAIGRHACYHPFWAGAWSARGLVAAPMQAYLRRILDPLPRETVVILNFGLADILFNARHKAVTAGFYAFPEMVEEAADAILATRDALVSQGFGIVIPAFLAPVPAMGQEYWSKTGPGRQLPNRVMGRMYHDLFAKVRASTPCLDTFEEMSMGETGAYLLRPEFRRPGSDHHPDYLRMHDLIRTKLAPFEDIPPCRPVPLAQHYPYTDVWITSLRDKALTRPSTCR